MIKTHLLRIAIVLVVFSFSGHLYASGGVDMSAYKKIAQDTIDQAKSGNIKDIAFLIKQQAKLVELGVAASKAYAKSNPGSAKALSLVTSKANDMKKLNLAEIEEHWHSGSELKKHGITLGDDDHFGATFSLIDSIIHPATSYIALVEYKKSGNKDHLEQVVAELSEVLEHINHIK